MRDFFNMDGPFFTVINRLGDLILLNVLWLLCCLPIITIGASTTALYFETMKLADNNEGYIVRNFFRSFKQNFLQSTAIWLILAVSGFGIGYYLYNMLFHSENMGASSQLIAFSIVLMLCIVYAMIFVYAFPLQSKFVNKIKHTIKNALILGIRHLPMTAIIIASYAIAIFCFIKFSFLVPVFLLIGVAAIAYGQSFIFNKIFNIYINKDKSEEELAKMNNPDAWTIPEE